MNDIHQQARIHNLGAMAMLLNASKKRELSNMRNFIAECRSDQTLYDAVDQDFRHYSNKESES